MADSISRTARSIRGRSNSGPRSSVPLRSPAGSRSVIRGRWPSLPVGRLSGGGQGEAAGGGAAVGGGGQREFLGRQHRRGGRGDPPAVARVGTADRPAL